MTEDTLYWLFSTIAQTYGAIAGIIGMLTVYKLQQLSNAKKDAFKEVGEPLLDLLAGPELNLITPENTVKWWKDNPDKHAHFFGGSDHPRKRILSAAVSKINEIIAAKENIKRSFKVFLFAHMGIISGSIICLFFTESLVFHKISIISAIVLVVFISFLSTTVLCFSLLKE
ncbi:MAG: hypothetical protein JRJ11_13250 [Deltaproteobacteria bacterium]|nr:hypothetical protein [Deltaproteobacteria bacterium]